MISQPSFPQARVLISLWDPRAGFRLQAPGGEGGLRAEPRGALARGLTARAVTLQQHICAETLAQSQTLLVLTLPISPRRTVTAFWRFISSRRSFVALLSKLCLPTAGWHSQGSPTAWHCRAPCTGTWAELPALPKCHSPVTLAAGLCLSHLLTCPKLSLQPLSGGTKKKVAGSKCCWENVKDWQPTERGRWLKKDLEGLK